MTLQFIKKVNSCIDINSQSNAHLCLWCAQEKQTISDVVCHYNLLSFHCDRCTVKEFICYLVSCFLLASVNSINAVINSETIKSVISRFYNQVNVFCWKHKILWNEFLKSVRFDNDVKSAVNQSQYTTSSADSF